MYPWKKQQPNFVMAVSTRPLGPMSQKEAILTRKQVEGMIADGRTIIIIDGKVIKADAWLRFHPGGDKAIMHMVGRDATDEVNAYEPNNYKGRQSLLIAFN